MSHPTRLTPGDPAPDFTLTYYTGADVSLADLRGGKVIVYFYPAAMTSRPRSRSSAPATH